MKKSHQLVFLLLFAVLLAGSASAVTYISNCSELQNMRFNLMDDYVLANDIDFAFCPGCQFEPIGDNLHPFTGSFDGQYYKIIDLCINKPGIDNVALFGATSGIGEIKNVGLENVNIIGKNNTAALVAENHKSITYCYSTNGTVKGNDYVGGLVSSNGTTANPTGSITKSYSTAAVTSTTGLAGGLVAVNVSLIENCYARGPVSTPASGLAPHPYIGGLVGENQRGQINRSYATGSVSGPSGFVSHTGPGGLIGNSYGSTAYNFWDTQTSGENIGASGYCPPCLNNTAGVFGRTTAQMEQESTFTSAPPTANWDFVTVWDIDGVTNEGYPFLRWPIPPPAAISLSLDIEPLFIKGSDFTTADAVVSNSGGSTIAVDVVVKLVDAVSRQEIAEHEEETVRQNLLLAAGATEPISLIDWIDALGNSKQALGQGNYTLSAVVKKAGTNEILDEGSLIFTVGPAKRVPVPELDVLLLPLLLSIVLFVLWKKRSIG